MVLLNGVELEMEKAEKVDYSEKLESQENILVANDESRATTQTRTKEVNVGVGGSFNAKSNEQQKQRKDGS